MQKLLLLLIPAALGLVASSAWAGRTPAGIGCQIELQVRADSPSAKVGTLIVDPASGVASAVFYPLGNGAEVEEPYKLRDLAGNATRCPADAAADPDRVLTVPIQALGERGQPDRREYILRGDSCRAILRRNGGTQRLCEMRTAIEQHEIFAATATSNINATISAGLQVFENGGIGPEDRRPTSRDMFTGAGGKDLVPSAGLIGAGSILSTFGALVKKPLNTDSAEHSGAL